MSEDAKGAPPLEKSSADSRKKSTSSTTDVPRMYNQRSLGVQAAARANQQNAGKLVATLVRQALLRKPCQTAEKSAVVSQLVESLVWPFVTRLSSTDRMANVRAAWGKSKRSLFSKPPEGQALWLSNKEFLQIGKSIDHLVFVIDKYADEENREQNFLKFHLDTILFKGFADPTGMAPPRDAWNVDRLFVGWMNRFVSRCIARKDISFLYSLQKGTKKGWPAQGPFKLAAAYKKHAERFSTDHGRIESEDLKLMIIQCSYLVFHGIEKEPKTKFIPRGSACGQFGRRDGGALELFEPYQFPSPQEEKDVGKLRALNVTLEEWRSREFDRCYKQVERVAALHQGLCDPDDPRLAPCQWEIKKSAMADEARQAHREARDYWIDLYLSGKPLQDQPMIGSRGKPLRDRSGEVITETRRLLGFELVERISRLNTDLAKTLAGIQSLCKDRGPWDLDVLGIAEPGKYRIISKMDGYLGTAIQPMQGAMLSCWKRRRESTMLCDDLAVRMNEIWEDTKKYPELCFWASVDYEAATDLVKQHGTFLALEGCARSKYFELARYAFQNGKARYPSVRWNGTKLNGELVDEEVQGAFSVDVKDGQPMGHPLSFPLLCIINLAVYLCAIDRWVHEDPENRFSIGVVMARNVLVNGDDMLFKCSLSFYRIFNIVAAEAGFKISTGKQYLSRRFAMINSQLFEEVEGDRYRLAGVRRRGYLNLNIVKGVSVKKTSDVEAVPTQISRDANKMISLVPWAASVIPSIMSRWREDWFGERFQPNWYLPVHLGGIGFDPKWGPENYRVTQEQRWIAACYINKPNLQLYRMKGMDIPTFHYVDSLLEYRMLAGDVSYCRTETEQMAHDSGDSWLGKVCYASRLKEGSCELESDCVFANKYLLKKQPWNIRLKSASRATIERYRTVTMLTGWKGPCPPLVNLDRKKFLPTTLNEDQVFCLDPARIGEW